MKAGEVEKNDTFTVSVSTSVGSAVDPDLPFNGTHNQNPNLEAGQWLSSKGVFAGGSDTIAFEYVPSKVMPVHVHFLVENGIHILEALDMEALAAAKAYEFAFLAAPLKIIGGTGAPIRPLAAVPK